MELVLWLLVVDRFLVMWCVGVVFGSRVKSVVFVMVRMSVMSRMCRLRVILVEWVVSVVV